MLISVIIPTHNRAGLVLRAIDSVLSQSYKRLELIVVDDGSTDDTAFWMSRCYDQRLRYVQIKNAGVSAARNFGVFQAKADWICFLDSDDVWHRHKLSEQIRFHDQNREILVSQTDDIWIRNGVRVNKMEKHKVREESFFTDSLKRCMLTCSSLMIHKPLFESLSGFDESLKVCEDYDLCLRLMGEHKIGFVHKKLVTKFGGHDNQLSRKYPVMDEFRLVALEKLLVDKNLTDTQRDLIKSEIQFKQQIIKAGAKKRTK